MNAISQKAVTLYEEEGATIEEIAQSCTLELEDVKLILQANSVLFRKKVKRGEELGITEDEMKSIRDEMVSMALHLENDLHAPTKASLLKFLWNEGKGRNNVTEANGRQLNIILFNKNISAARNAVAKALDVQSEVRPADVAV